MRKQLVLFAGLHKTGSTSIQKTCAANKRGLLNAGFVYPELVGGENRFANHTYAFHFMFRKEPHKGGYSGRDFYDRHPADAIALGNRLKKDLSSRLRSVSTNLLMVAEGVSLLSAEELRGMKGWFNEMGWNIRLFCYVRRLSSWINSMISQRTISYRHLTIRAAVDEFLEVSGVIRPRIISIREIFPDAVFLSYEAALKHHFGPVGFFFEAIGVTQMEEISFVRANEGRSDCATRLISSINEVFGPGITGEETNPRYANSRVFRLATIPGAKFSLREHEVAPLLSLLVAENQWLRETLDEEFYDNELVFHNEPCLWSEESLARLRELASTSTPVVRSLISSYLATLNLTL